MELLGRLAESGDTSLPSDENCTSDSVPIIPCLVDWHQISEIGIKKTGRWFPSGLLE